jgi:hypothetical protein
MTSGLPLNSPPEIYPLSLLFWILFLQDVCAPIRGKVSLGSNVSYIRSRLTFIKASSSCTSASWVCASMKGMVVSLQTRCMLLVRLLLGPSLYLTLFPRGLGKTLQVHLLSFLAFYFCFDFFVPDRQSSLDFAQ